MRASYGVVYDRDKGRIAMKQFGLTTMRSWDRNMTNDVTSVVARFKLVCGTVLGVWTN
jgi:hypothetical protein